MAAIGSCWAAGSWADPAWAAGTWADAVIPEPPPPVTQRGSGRKNRTEPFWREYQEMVTGQAERFDEMRAQALQIQLDQIAKERADALRGKQVLAQQNQKLTEVLGEMKNQASAMAAQGSSLFNQINTLTQPLDAAGLLRKERQLENLEKARQAREANKKAEEDKRKKMLKNLAKARKAKGK